MVKSITHVCNKEVEIALMQQDITYIKNKIDDLHLKVVGSNNSDGLVDDVNQMKGGLSAVKWVYGAAIGGIGLILAFWK